MLRRSARLSAIFCLTMMLAISAVVLAVETGAFDRALSNRAREALARALGPAYQAEIESTELRFSRGVDMAVEANGVVIRKINEEGVLGRADTLRLVIDPLALIGGQVRIEEIYSEGIDFSAQLLAAGPPMDFTKLRVDQVPVLIDRMFAEIDTAWGFILRGGLDTVELADVTLSRDNPGEGEVIAAIDNLTLSRSKTSSLLIEGQVSIGNRPTTVRIESDNVGERAEAVDVRIDGFDLEPILLRRLADGSPRQGYAGQVAVALLAQRATDSAPPKLTGSIMSRDGTLYMDGNPQPVTSLDVALGYDFSKDTVELRPSRAVLGPTIVPFSGALIDLDRLDADYAAGSGIGIDLLVAGGTASVPSTGEPPVPFDFKALGRYLYASSELQVDQLAVSTPVGSMTGSLHVDFGVGSPQISFSSQIAGMQTAAVKQLWPYWIADKPRDWVINNLIGGTVTRGSIGIFIPAGRMTLEPKPLRLRGEEMKLAFDVVNTRVNTTGDIPPVRDASARVEVNGEKVSVNFTSGASYFKSGRSVKLDGGKLTISDVYARPLMADIDLSMSGKADAVGELITYKPINALARTGLTPADLSGDVKGRVALTVGLINSQRPPPAIWKADLALSKVSVAKEFDGRKIDDFDGTVAVDNNSARVDGQGDIDDVSMEIALVEPISPNSTVKRERVVKAVLSNEERQKLVPGLDDLISGPMAMSVSLVDTGRQKVEIDLGRTELSLPWVGWSKGSGVAAKAVFEVAEKDGVTAISAFDLSGDGFGASGAFSLNKSGLVSAAIDRVRLSSSDSYAVRITRDGRTFDVAVNGASADIRSLIGRLKSGASSNGGGDAASEGGQRIRIKAEIGGLLGFNSETLSNVSLQYSATGSSPTGLDFKAVTSSGQAVVASLVQRDGLQNVSLTSSDAGALIRFVDLYTHMQGGLLNLRLTGPGNGTWTGGLDVRNFNVQNEQRLQTIVSSPAGADGRSLNSAVKRDIDVSSEKFQRAFARIAATPGALRVENGVVRGEQIGATFQGIVRDESGRMDMTGTFMPAYGLNRLFGELPLIGVLLGNGRDRGLLGITFRASGPTSDPKLAINPLSIIAPGVFRQIFEFR